MAGRRSIRELLRGDRPMLVAGAHNGLSAKLVEEAGLDGVWASGFEMSASYAVPDANVLTMSENLAICKSMADAVDIPIIADCDNGYGNAINVIRTVQEFEQAGISGMCIEDNIFPKRCSFYAGVQRELVPVEEHAGKIRAAKKAQRTEEFFVIARSEALIAGWGQEEALTRATAYAEAGADAVLVHSKAKTFDETREFASNWTLDTPLVVVPTIFAQTTANELYEHGFKIVIFANHGLRASIKTMRETFAVLKEKQYAASVDDRIVSIPEVFDLVGLSELKEREASFMPAGGEQVTAVILAAGYDETLGPLIEDKPKGMLDIKGKTILERQIGILNEVGIKEVAVVRGYKKEMIDLPNVRFYDNEQYEKNGEMASLFTAEKEIEGRVVVLYGDIIFERSILERLLKSPADVSLVADRSWADHHGEAGGADPKPDLVVAANPPDSSLRFVPMAVDNPVKKIGAQIPFAEATGEFIGMAMLSPKGSEMIKEAYRRAAEQFEGKPFQEATSVETASFCDLVQQVIDDGAKVACVDIYKGWMEIDTFEDYQRAWANIKK